MQLDPTAREPNCSSWRRLRHRSALRVLGLATAGGLTAALTASAVAPAARTPVPRALPVNTDLLGATGALPSAVAPANPIGLVPIGASRSIGHGTAPRSAAPRSEAGTTVPVLGPDHLGIPARVLAAYQRAEATTTRDKPGCQLRWWVLAGIGKIEASHAEGGRLDGHGSAVPPIFGPVLDGQPGMATVPDTDGGRLDADPVWDRAVGPMQFLPSSWQVYGAGGDPQNVDDAALAAARYLCAGEVDLSLAPQLVSAIFNYNHSDAYVADVLGWAHGYERAVTATADAPLMAQLVRISTLARPTRAAAALQAHSTPPRIVPRPANPRTALPDGTRTPTSNALPGAPTVAAPAAASASPAAATATPAAGTTTAPTGTPAPAAGTGTAGAAPMAAPVASAPAPVVGLAPPVGAPAAAATSPVAVSPVAAGPAPVTPIAAAPAAGAAGTPACQPPTPIQVAPPGQVSATQSATVLPAAPAAAQPTVSTSPAPLGQPGPITEVGTISARTCMLATLTRPDGTVMTVDLALLRATPVVGDRVLVTGSLSPDGTRLIATTMIPAP